MIFKKITNRKLSKTAKRNIAKTAVMLGLVTALCTNLIGAKPIYAATQSDISKGKNINYNSQYSLTWSTSPAWNKTSMSTYENSGKPYLDVKEEGKTKYAYATCSFNPSDRKKDSNGNYTSYAHYTNAFYYQSLNMGKPTAYTSDPFTANKTNYGSRLLWLNYVTLTDKKEYKFTPVVANEGEEVQAVHIYTEYFDASGYFAGEIPEWVAPGKTTSIKTGQKITTSGVNASKNRTVKNVVFLLKDANSSTGIGAGNRPLGFEGNIKKKYDGTNLNDYDYVYICYAPHTYSFDLNGGVTSDNKTTLANISRYGVVDVTKQMVSHQNSLKRDGYTFAGWKVTTKNEGTVIGKDALVSFTSSQIETSAGTAKSIYNYLGSTVFSNQLFTNCTFTAQWVPNTYTVKYDSNGGTGSMEDSTATYNADFITKQNTFVKEGYKFTGWNESSDGTGTAWNLDSKGVFESGKPWKWTYMKNITLYAQWKDNKYTIHYDMNKADTKQYEDQTAIIDKSVTLREAPKREGYKFLGWQVYSGATESPYKENMSTVTDPLKRNVSVYKASGIVKNMRKTLGTVTLCAIWEHIDITDEKSRSSILEWEGEFVSDLDEYVTTAEKIRPFNTGSETPARGYYINTNKLPAVPYYRVASVNYEENKYIKINAYGIRRSINGGKYETVTVKDNFNAYGSNSVMVSVSDNNYVVLKNWVKLVDTWNDAHTSSANKLSDYIYDPERYSLIAGDKDVPTVTGNEKIDTAAGIDKSQYETYPVNISSKDALSGLDLNNSYIIITNTDNGVHAEIPVADFINDGFEDAIIKWQEIDIINKDSFAKDLFNGNFSVDYHIQDKVGNVYISDDPSGVFGLTAKLYDRENKPLDYVALKGVTFKIKIKTFGYADAVKISFPKEWYDNDVYPLCAYYGSLTTGYDETKLEEVKKDYMYIKTDNDKNGEWEQELVFVSPLNVKEGSAKIEIRALKGDLKVIDEANILIRDKESLQIKELRRGLEIVFDKKNILSTLKEHIVSVN